MYCWIVQKLKNGDFKVEYPDNTKDGARIWEDEATSLYPYGDGFAFTDKNLSSAPTTTKVKPELEYIPGLGMQEKVYADMVEEPEHYKIFADQEVIDIIRKSLSKEEFAGYCKGNILKYRLRDKHNNEEDFAKSKQYKKYMQDAESV